VVKLPPAATKISVAFPQGGVVFYWLEVIKLMADTQNAAGTLEAKTRHRSPNYPAIALPEAIDRVAKFYAADRKAGAPLEAALKHMGFSGKHGKSMMVASALKKYGLVEDVAGRLVPTQRAVEILVLEKADPRRKQAIREAALNPDINRELFAQFSEDGFPSEESLAAELVAYKGFNPEAVNAYVKDFFVTMEFASLTNAVEVSLTEEEDPAMVTEIESPKDYRPGEAIKRAALAASVESTPAKVMRRFTWPLSKEITATVEFVGGDVAVGHIDLLQKYLELAKMAAGQETPATRVSKATDS
jgi:hypothetical protein